VPANVLEENSRQMDRHKKRLVFRTLIGNSEVRVEVLVTHGSLNRACPQAELTSSFERRVAQHTLTHAPSMGAVQH